jgi:ABC-type histidine transport system ATPase subunit
MGFAREVADGVCFLHDGAIVARGAPAERLGSPSPPRPAASSPAVRRGRL